MTRRGEKWDAILQQIWRWTSAKIGGAISVRTPPQWFLRGGGRKLKSGGVTTEVWSRGKDAPQYWVLRLDQADEGFHFRRWRTDVVVSLTSDLPLSLRATVSYYLDSGFVGSEADTAPVEATSPKFIKDLLQSPGEEWMAGSEALSCKARQFRAKMAHEFESHLKCPGRRCPIVAVATLKGEAARFPVNPDDLAWQLAGAASVYAYEMSEDAFRELDHFLPPQYRLRNGMVRIYLENLNVETPDDCHRHRFIEWDEGQDDDRQMSKVRKTLHSSLARRSIWRTARSATGVADVDDLRRAKQAHESSRRLNEVNDQLLKMVPAEKVADAEGYYSEAQKLLGELQGQNDSLKEKLEAAEYAVEEKKEKLAESESVAAILKERVAELERQAGESRRTADEPMGLKDFPKDLASLLEWVSIIFSDRVLIADSAYSAASSWQFELPKAWHALYCIATHLYDIYFQVKVSSAADIPKLFKEKSGLDLALTEGRKTNEDGDLVKMRRVMVCGKQVDCAPHVKLGTKRPRLLRIHFCADHEWRKIVIGHCGDHLETAGTQKNRR